MKKILALCLSLCVLISCFSLFAGAANEATALSVSDHVTSLLTPKTSSLHVKNGLLYSYVAKADAPLALGNGETLEVDPLFNVSSYQGNEDLRELDYDYSVTGRFSFADTATQGVFAEIGPLSVALVDNANLKFEFDPNFPSVNAPIASFAANKPISLTVIAKMDPNYANDGAITSCNHSFTLLALDRVMCNTENLFATTSNVQAQSLIVGEGAPVNVHSLQIYDRAISELDCQQNIFADVLYMHGLTASDPSYMTDAAREAYIAPMFESKDPYALTKEEVAEYIAEGEAALSKLEDIYDYSAFLLGDDAEEWWIESHNELLNVAGEDDWSLESYFALDDALLESFHELYYDLEEITEETISNLMTEILTNANPYAEVMSSVLTFDGYQARLEGTVAIRARFSVDRAAVAELENQGFAVTYGATLQNGNGDVLQISTVYGENADLAPVFTSEETDLFAMTVEAKSQDVADESFLDECSAAYIFGAFVSIDDGESAYTALLSCENALFGSTASIQRVCAYFFDNGYKDAPAVALGANPTASIANAAFTACLPEKKQEI